MTFYQQLNPMVELFYSGQWNDHSNRTRGGKTAGFGIDISRGRSDEAETTEPTKLNVVVNNYDGLFSPRNPDSSLYGLIGRNTPIRVWLGQQHLGATNHSEVATTSHVAPSVTAEKAGLMISAWLGASNDYTSFAPMTLGAETGDGSVDAIVVMASAHQSIAVAGATGTRTATSNNSTAYVAASVLMHGDSVSVEEILEGGGFTSATSDVTLTTDATTQAGWWLVAVQGWGYFPEVRGRLMPDAPQDNEGGWILLADVESPVTETFHRQIRIWARKIKLDGEQEVKFFGIADPNLDNHAHLYVLSGVDDWWIRATCEVSEWPSSWNRFGRDVHVDVQGSGILRRVQQGTAPVFSAIRRTITGHILASMATGQGLLVRPVAYWPLEDDSDSTEAASAFPNLPPMIVVGGEVEFAGSETQPGGSDSLPDLLNSTGDLSGNVPNMGPNWDTDEGFEFSFVISYTGTAVPWTPIEIRTLNGPYKMIRMRFSTTVVVEGIATDGSTTTIGTISTDLSDGRWYFVRLRVLESAGNIVYQICATAEDGEAVISCPTQVGSPIAGTTTGIPVNVKVRHRGGGTTGSIGHPAVWAHLEDESKELVLAAFDGYVGETAGRRIERLCQEERIAFHPVGDIDATETMGIQRIISVLNLIKECEDADLGMLFEPRTALGLAYRTRSSLYNQTTILALDYESCHLGHPLEPTDDDRLISNDITVDRVGGSSFRVVEETGPLSVNPPPDGVGTYDDEVTVNVQTDSQLQNHAGWRLHLGTIDEARYPVVRLRNLAPPNCTTDPDITDAGAIIDMGDKLTIDNLPDWLPPDQVQALLQGYREHIDWYEWDLRTNTSPASPFTVATRRSTSDTVGPTDPSRRDTAGSELNADFDAGTDSTMSVLTTQGPTWGLTASSNMDLPFDVNVGGAQIRVTAIGSPSSNVQTFTVSTTIQNDVGPKTIPAGTAVRLWQPAVRGM